METPPKSLLVYSDPMSRTKILLVSLPAVALAAAALAAQTGLRLVVNGKVASSDVRVIGGKAYVPLADVARALDMTVAKSAAGYAMERGGGANQLTGFTGKMGTEVFTGKWRFTVLDWQRVDAYKPKLVQMHSWENEYEAKSGEDLVVVSCRVKNGTKVKDELVFSTSWEGTNNALTDDQEQSYQPVGFDVTESETAPVGVTFLPGAAINFKMIFRVPKGTEPKDLIFTAMRYGMRASYDQKKEAPQDVRVSLKRD